MTDENGILWLTIPEAKDEMKTQSGAAYAESTIAQLAREGKIEAQRVGEKTWLIRSGELLSYRDLVPQRKPRTEPGRRRRAAHDAGG